MVDTDHKEGSKMTVILSRRNREIIAYCAALRDVSGEVIPNADWVRLVDMLAIAMGTSDAQRECSYCKSWKYAGSVSGEEHGRGRCTRISYDTSQGEAMYYLPVYVGRWDDAETDYGRVQDIQGTVDVFTVGNFCCSYFYPRRKEHRC